MSIIDLIQSHQLSAAIAACKQVVRDKPADIKARSTLCQLFCFCGDWERADTQLATIAQQDMEMAVGVGLIRQLMRGEVAREQFFSEGRTPELVCDPTPAMEALLQALIAAREKNNPEITQHVAKLHDSIPLFKGTVNGQPFEFARDLDDMLSGFMEVLSTNGKFFLMPLESIISLTFREPERLQDQIWRSANIEVQGGMTGEVYIPTRYCRHLNPDETLSEPLMMGGESNWEPIFEGGPVTGQGQKMFVFGDNAYNIMELKQIEIEQPSESVADGE